MSVNNLKLRPQDSPTSKLLYNKEVQGYKTKVRQYYQNVARLPRIPEDAMQSYLKQLSEVRREREGGEGRGKVWEGGREGGWVGNSVFYFFPTLSPSPLPLPPPPPPSPLPTHSNMHRCSRRTVD